MKSSRIKCLDSLVVSQRVKFCTMLSSSQEGKGRDIFWQPDGGVIQKLFVRQVLE